MHTYTATSCFQYHICYAIPPARKKFKFIKKSCYTQKTRLTISSKVYIFVFSLWFHQTIEHYWMIWCDQVIGFEQTWLIIRWNRWDQMISWDELSEVRKFCFAITSFLSLINFLTTVCFRDCNCFPCCKWLILITVSMKKFERQGFLDMIFYFQCFCISLLLLISSF